MKISTSQSAVPQEPGNNTGKPTENHQQLLSLYEDDLIARIRRAREAAQRKIDAFGDPSEYEVRKIYGQRTDIRYDDVNADASEQNGSNKDTTATTDEEA